MADEQSNIKSFPNAANATSARKMPNNLPAEQNLLGAILLENSVLEKIDDRLLADHFYKAYFLGGLDISEVNIQDEILAD